VRTRCFCLIQINRICFNAPLSAGSKRERVPDDGKQALELPRWQVRRRSAAEEDRIDFMRLSELRQLALQRFQVGIDQVVAAGNEREVAIAAAMAAEGDVDVRCAAVSCHLSFVPCHLSLASQMTNDKGQVTLKP